MIARDAMHQNQWLAAIEELEADGLGGPIVPDTFPTELQNEEVAHQFWNCSDGTESKAGRWAKGTAIDGAKLEYLSAPKPLGPKIDEVEPVDPRLHGTPKRPLEPVPS